MNPILDSLPVWSTAQALKTSNRGTGAGNQSLLGIKKLRELILELAVRGKLVPQDPNDEPASVLLEKIEKEKARLVKEGKIKKQEVLPEIGEDKKPYDLPVGWEYVRLYQIIQISSGDGLTSANMESNGTIPVFGGNGINGYHNLANVFKPTLVIGRVGFYCGSIHITPKAAWVTDNAFITTYSEENIDIKFLYWLLKGSNLNENDSATAQPVISGRKVYPIIVGFPPLAEQHRIVAKVDELMALCDELENQQTDSNIAHETLVATLLGSLIDTENSISFNESWQRIANHFDILFTTEHSIDQLKKTILQLAVMGKLVPQNPEDEPTSKLLKKIAKEKAQLVKEGKIKKQLPLPEITEDEKPFKLPEGWEFMRLGDIANKIGSGSTPKGGNSAYSDNGIVFLRSQNVRNEGLQLDDVAYITNETNEKMSNTIVFPNDILLNITGGSLGRSTVFPNKLNSANVSQHVTIIRLTEISSVPYIHHCILSPYIQDLIWGRQVGANREGLSKKILELFEIPIPPLAEQHRIVSKVDELFALCDGLKKRLVEAQTLQNQMAMAVVEQALQ